MASFKQTDKVTVKTAQGFEQAEIVSKTQNAPIKYLVKFNDGTTSWWSENVISQ